MFDFAWGDEVFDGYFTNRDPVWGFNLFGVAEVEYSFLADFDNGLAAQDASCLTAQMVGVSAARAEAEGFCNLGLGAIEASTSHGDSGGGAFVDGKLAALTSYGFGFNPFDLGGGDNSGFGELAGYVPMFIHTDFIRNAIASAVPEPAAWVQMLLGFGLIGAACRRPPAIVGLRQPMT